MLSLAAAFLPERVLLPGQFGAPNPSFGHAPPYRSALRIARELRHVLALGGMSQKFFRGNHRPISVQDGSQLITEKWTEGSGEPPMIYVAYTE
jgi:hypothetical protein